MRSFPRSTKYSTSTYGLLIPNCDITEVLEQVLKITISEDPEDEKKRLMSLSKDEIIEQLLAAKVTLTFLFNPFSHTHNLH